MSWMLIIALTGLLYINCTVVLYTQSIKNAVYANEEQRLASRYHEMQVQYYQNVLKNQNETRALWHDLNKHITAMSVLAESAGKEKAKEGYEQIRQAFDGLDYLVETGNAILNAILNHNIERAKSYDITVNLDVRVSTDIHISAIDLSVIIGNTFDNAIEECVSLTDDSGDDVKIPQIMVTLARHNRMLFYEIANPCKNVSGKKPGKHRGYGLDNVKRCVERYGGAIEYGKDGGVFKVSIRMNCPATTSEHEI